MPRRIRALWALLLAGLMLGLGAPAPAQAASTLIVADTADTATGTLPCTTAGDNCTLRQAITQANGDVGDTFPPVYSLRFG